MTVSQIIQSVKLCIDHESHADARLADSGEDAYMDNIIRAKISDALIWATRMAARNAELGVSEVVTGKSVGPDEALTVESYDEFHAIGIIRVPAGIEAAGISRVRIAGWHKAAVPSDDTDDDAAMMFDDDSKGTADRPMAVIMQGAPVRLLVQPYTGASGEEVEVTYAALAKDFDTTDDTTEIAVPAVLRSALLYYIAYLLLTAYGDSRAQSMLAVAVQALGTNEKK